MGVEDLISRRNSEDWPQTFLDFYIIAIEEYEPKDNMNTFGINGKTIVSGP